MPVLSRRRAQALKNQSETAKSQCTGLWREVAHTHSFRYRCYDFSTADSRENDVISGGGIKQSRYPQASDFNHVPLGEGAAVHILDIHQRRSSEMVCDSGCPLIPAGVQAWSRSS